MEMQTLRKRSARREEHMNENRSRKRKGGHQPGRRIVVRGERRKEPDLRKLARALIDVAQAQAEADAQASHDARRSKENDEKGDMPSKEVA